MECQNKNRFSILERKRKRALNQIRSRRDQLFQRSRLILEQEDQNQSSSSQNFELKQQITNNASEMVDESVEIQMKRLSIGQNHENHSKNKKKKKFNISIKKLFQIPDWMNQVPQQFNQFYGAARPDGKTVIIIIENNQAEIYDKLGMKLHSFRIKGKPFANTILEGFLITQKNQMEEKQNYQVIISDMICWKKNIFTTESFEFRYSWLQSNIHSIAMSMVDLNIGLLKYFVMSKEGLAHIYNENFGFEKQGLYFVHKDSFYLHGNNSNTLIWKDFKTSKYPIDQNNQIHGVGFLRKNGLVVTSDDYQIGKINQSEIFGVKKAFIRFKIKGMNFLGNSTNNQFVQFTDFEPVSIKKMHLSRADPLSRLIFQFRMRNDPLKIEEIFASYN